MESRTFSPIASFSASSRAFSSWIARFSQFFDSLRNPLSIAGCACSHGQFARSPPRATAFSGGALQHFAASAYPPKHAARRELHMRGPHDDQQDPIRTPVCRGTTTVSRIEPHVAHERWKIAPIRARNAARAGPRWFRPRPRRRRQHSRRSSSSEAEKASRLLAGLIARQAHSANLRPERINRARRRHADLTDQSGAAISFATHATVIVIDEESRNPIELGIALRREPRPIRRKRTARAATPA